jgi:hypothetical protein
MSKLRQAFSENVVILEQFACVGRAGCVRWLFHLNKLSNLTYHSTSDWDWANHLFLRFIGLLNLC